MTARNGGWVQPRRAAPVTRSYNGAVGRSAHLLAAVGLHAADQEVAARDAWLRWVDDDRYHGLNAGPFELLAKGSGECGRS